MIHFWQRFPPTPLPEPPAAGKGNRMRKILTMMGAAFLLSITPAAAGENELVTTEDHVAPGEVVLKNTMLACRTIAIGMNVVKFLRDDKEAILEVVKRGDCINLQSGSVVSLMYRGTLPRVDASLFFVCLRPKGKPDCWWTAKTDQF